MLPSYLSFAALLSTILIGCRPRRRMAARAADVELLVVFLTPGHVPTLTEDGCPARSTVCVARVATA